MSLLIAGLLLFAPDAGAQVMINQAALDQLAGIAPGAVAPPVIGAPPVIRQAPRKVSYRRVIRRHVGLPPRLAAKPAGPVQPVLVKPAIPPPAPAKPALAPAMIRFAAGGADLPGNSAGVLQPFCGRSHMIVIDAYAAADPAEPSAAARLSMSRAFAIRDALTACGVPDNLIIPRANGAAKTADPDAAEISASP